MYLILMINKFHSISVPEAPPTSTIRVLQLFVNESASVLNISWIHVVSVKSPVFMLLNAYDLPYREAMYHNTSSDLYQRWPPSHHMYQSKAPALV